MSESIYTIYLRKHGNKWVLTDSPERGAASLMGPDRLGNHLGAEFDTMSDAAYCAHWRIDRLNDGEGRVTRGDPW